MSEVDHGGDFDKGGNKHENEEVTADGGDDDGDGADGE